MKHSRAIVIHGGIVEGGIVEGKNTDDLVPALLTPDELEKMVKAEEARREAEK